MRISTLFLIIFSFGWVNLFAQPKPEIIQYTTSHGLSNTNVRSLLQDRHGFIWAGTNDGLNRFDAYNFEVFSYDPTVSNGLSDNGILSLFEDKAGNIWIGTNNGGLNRFNPKTYQFTSWQKSAESEENGISDNTIYCITEDKQGHIWFGTKRGGLNKFDPKTEQFTVWKSDENDPNSIPSNYIWTIKMDEQREVLWLGTSAGLVKFSLDGQMTHYPHEDSGIASILINEDHTLWIGTWGSGLQLFDPVQEKFTESYQADKSNPKGLQQSSVTSIVKAGNRDLWLSTYGGGIHYFNYQSRSFSHYKIEDKDNALAPNSQWKMIRDRAGNVWVGSLKGIIHVIPNSDKGFALFNRENTNNQLSNNGIWSIYGDQLTDLWVGTLNGLNHFSFSKDLKVLRCDVYNAPQLPNGRIKAITKDRQGSIWIGTWGKGVLQLKLDENNNSTIQHFSLHQTDLISNLILSIYADSKGKIWIGTLSGLSIYDPETESFTNFESDPNNPNSLSDVYIYSIYETRDGTMWIGTARGLNQFQESSQSFIHYQADPDQPGSLSHNKINAIFEDSQGRFWVGTDGGGLNQMDRATGTFEAITEKDGLKGNSIKGITESNHGELWISTNKGLNRLDVSKKEFKHYDASDGLQGNDFSTGSTTTLLSGHIVVGGAKGFNLFLPEQLQENEFIPPVAITSFKLFGKEVPVQDQENLKSPLLQSIGTAERLDLTYEHRVIEFDFTSLNYVKAHKNNFAYMLEGFDRDWRYTSADRRFATYTNLPAKDGYVFRVKASNNDGKWNEDGLELLINVRPPIWKTWWFQTALTLFILISAISFYRYRVNQIKRQKVRLEQLVEKRTEEVKTKNTELEQRNVELHQQQEEILAQRDYIEQKNKELTKQKQDLEKSYQNVQILSEIGNQVISKLDLEDVVMSVYQNVNALMDASGFGIGIYDEAADSIMFKGYIEKGEVLPTHKSAFDPKNDLASWCIHTNREIFINDVEAEYKHYVTNIHFQELEGEMPQSLIYLPLIHLEKKIGVITVQSFKKHAYTQKEINLLRNLAIYISIAVTNAATYYEVKQAHDVIKSKNKDIMDSLRYAETIQKSVLPIASNINQHLSEHFVIFKPKDVVSGDFYWFTHIEGRTFAAVVDCTGHGVPGAFMSLIGHELLDVIVTRERVFDPAKILELMHAGVRSVLQQDNQMNNDGMDVGLVMIETKRNQSPYKVTFAGAKRPLFYYAVETGFDELKGDRKSVGGWQKDQFVTFTNHELDLPSGSILYLSSDGFVDQHSLENKKYGTKKLRKVLHNICTLEMKLQEECLLNELHTHQSSQTQRDDITLFGLKL